MEMLAAEADRTWWAQQNECMQMRTMAFDWVDRSIPAIREYASRFPKRAAFVFGTGPSLSVVTSEQWTALAGYFSVGVNGAPVWIQDHTGHHDVPKIGFMTDRREFHSGKMDEYARGFTGIRKAGGMVIVNQMGYQFPHDHTVTVFGTPHPDMRFGLPITLTPKLRFNRAICPSIHLCVLLGFENIYLIGIDHTPDYAEGIEEDNRRANETLAAYQADYLSKRGVQLWECGERTCVTSIPFKKLSEVLNASDDVSPVARPATGFCGAPALRDNHAGRGVAVFS